MPQVDPKGPQRSEKRIFPIRAPEDVAAMFEEFGKLAAWWSKRLTIYRLETGKVYMVEREFQDRGGNRFLAGSEHVFVDSAFSPYEGVHALTFQDSTIVLEDADPVVSDFDEYFGTR